MFDDEPTLQFLTDAIKPYETVKRRWTTASVDYNTGEYVTMDQNNCPFEELPTCALASASIPFAFPPRLWKGHVLTDGANSGGWDLNIGSAIN